MPKLPNYSDDRQDRLDPTLAMCLICPITRKPLEYDHNQTCLISPAAGVVFPINDGIPLMVTELAIPIETRDT